MRTVSLTPSIAQLMVTVGNNAQSVLTGLLDGYDPGSPLGCIIYKTQAWEQDA